ncbi:MAG: SDR family oxidoreductase [Anaerolineales bacterium]|nr:SDR family oxidoreductase [Anaerolineales bacterium]
MNLTDRIALVTGSAHRVGKAIALELAAAGAQLVIHYNTSGDAAHKTVAEIEALGRRAVALPADLSRPAQINALFARVEAEFGALDVLVNSASIMETGDAATLSLEAWNRSLSVNLTAPFLCAQQAARLMRGRGGGVIINIADGSALRPWATYPAHSVSKAGLVMLTQVLAKAFAPAIRVNAVCPGPVLKPPDWDEARWVRVGQNTLLKRTGSGYHVAHAVRCLIENDYITGETLVVDGGERLR